MAVAEGERTLTIIYGMKVVSLFSNMHLVDGVPVDYIHCV